MTLSIGRAGLNPPLLGFSSYQFEGGGEMRLSGWLRGGGSLEEMVATREQVLGLVDNPDEAVVPVVCSDDPSVSGFYRVRSADVGNEPRMKLDSASVLPFDVTLQRVTAYAAPQFDSRLTHALRSGSAVSSASASAVHGVGPATVQYTRGSTALANLATRSLASGKAVYVNTWATSSSRTAASWTATPAGFYDGSAVIERRIDGGKLVPVTAATMPAGVDPETGWRITNGLVQVFPAPNEPWKLRVLTWTGTTWAGPDVRWVAGSDGFVASVTILRNTPERCSVRLVVGYGSAAITRPLDVTLRRGDRNALLYTPGFAQIDSVPGTTSGVTGAVRASSAVDGATYILSTSVAAAIVTATNMAVNNASPVDVGVATAFTGATALNTTSTLALQYAAFLGERVDTAKP